MTLRAILGTVGLMAALAAGCGPAARHRILSRIFDGVPEPPPAAAPASPEGALAAQTGGAVVRDTAHGPYAAKMCQACHAAAATNALLVPADELCLQCHDLQQDRKFVHGPLSSGGCLACHDPHSSRYRNLLVSESEGFCVQCHDRSALELTATHAGLTGQCTRCHDAHMSDQKYLLK